VIDAAAKERMHAAELASRERMHAAALDSGEKVKELDRKSKELQARIAAKAAAKKPAAKK
jgi:hypothetical protein